jgi:hypothetical protein
MAGTRRDEHRVHDEEVTRNRVLKGVAPIQIGIHLEHEWLK